MNNEMLDRLAGFIRDAAGADSVDIQSAQTLSGGAVQENWRIGLLIKGGAWAGELAAVLRCDSPTEGVSISHGRAEEFALLKAAFAAGVIVPEPLWLCTDRAVIGRQFFIMRQIQGTAAGHVLVKDFSYGADRPALARQLGEQMARIHSIKPGREDLGFLEGAENANSKPALARIAKHRAYLDTLPQPYPVLEWGLNWLEDHAPKTSQLTLVHGDFRTGNYMVDANGLTGILDWEFANWSDPMEDIGWFCAKCWRFGQKSMEAGGVGQRQDFLQGYQSVAGWAPTAQETHYWEVMAHMTWAIIALQQAQRHISGKERSLLLALTGHIVPELEWEILNMTEVVA